MRRPDQYRTTARTGAVLTAAALLLAACGSDADGEDDGSGGDGPTRTVEHALGTAEDVPEEPQRVVALDPYISLPTAALGDMEIVGSSALQFSDPHPPFVPDDRTEGTEDVGWFTELDITGIHALEPDLIIGLESFVEPSQEQLEKIAPTVALPLDHGEWRERLALAGDALGIPDEVEAELEQYDEQASGLADRLAAETDVTDEDVTVLQFRSVEDIRIYTDFCSTEVLNDAGLTLHATDDTPEGENSVQVGSEQLTQADSRFVFYLIGSAGNNPDEAEETFETVSQQPLWGRLGAVQRDDTRLVDTDWWFNCGSLQANALILDDVEDALLPD